MEIRCNINNTKTIQEEREKKSKINSQRLKKYPENTVALEPTR